MPERLSNRPSHPEAPREKIRDSRPLEEGQTVRIGRQALKVYEVPGHTPGHVIFVFDSQKNPFGSHQRTSL